MKAGQKKWIRIFWILLIKIKAVSNANFEVWLLFVPLFSIRNAGNKISVNFLVLQKICDHTVIPWRSKIKKLLIDSKIKKGKTEIFKKFANGEKLKIVFVTSRPGIWCFNYLYPMLKNDSRFDVNIVIMPDVKYPNAQLVEYMKKTYHQLLKKGYSPILGYDHEANKIFDLRAEINPDIVFYADFWKPHFVNKFYITNFLDKITILNEYGYSVRQDEMTCNFELNNLVDIYFRPSSVHLKMAQSLMNNGGKNVLVVGAPKLDEKFDDNYKAIDIWKKQDTKKKRIIWAPHYNYNTGKNFYQNDAFFYLYDYMLELAEKYKDKIQFAFRPHPVLYTTLIKEWSIGAIEKYYRKWANLENGQISEGDFVDLFMTSDAMIMDSCSFLAEYTAFDKPLFYTKTKTSRENFNDFGEMIFKYVYAPETDLYTEIETFIQNVVISGNDYKAEERHKFVEQYFGKINGHTASENIYNEIIHFLERGELE